VLESVAGVMLPVGESGGLTAVESPEAAVACELIEDVLRASSDVARRGRLPLAGLIADADGPTRAASWSSEGIGSRRDGVDAAGDVVLETASFVIPSAQSLDQ